MVMRSESSKRFILAKQQSASIQM